MEFSLENWLYVCRVLTTLISFPPSNPSASSQEFLIFHCTDLASNQSSTPKLWTASNWCSSSHRSPTRWPAITSARPHTPIRRCSRRESKLKHMVSEQFDIWIHSRDRARLVSCCTLDIFAPRLSSPRFCLSNENVSLPVAITWKDAPENQSPVAGNDYVVRCVVTANPPPTIGKKSKANFRDDKQYLSRLCFHQTGCGTETR